jgi:small-conductance mechanosensitive channel
MLNAVNTLMFLEIAWPWIILFGFYLLVLFLAYIFKSRIKQPFNLFLTHFHVQAKLSIIVFLAMMAFDAVMKLFFSKDFWIYSKYNQVILITFLLMRYSWELIDDLYAWQYKVLKRKKRMSSATGLNGLKHLAKVMVSLLLVINAMDQLNISYTGILTLAGAGSLAGAFAAKDIVKNIFGGLIIFFDQPFKVGDFIISSDKEIKGVVDHVGWRATSIINVSSQVPVIVPNGQFISMAVSNVSRRTCRRLQETVTVSFNDLDKVVVIIRGIESFIQSLDFVDQDKTIKVYLKDFGDFSVSIFIDCFFSDHKGLKYYAHRGQILLGVAKIIEQNGATMPFPTYQILSDGSGEEKTSGDM